MAKLADMVNLGQKVLYHITPTRLVPGILKEGLKPKTSKLEAISGAPTRGRVYLAYYQEDLRELLDEFRKKGYGKEPFTMLEVEIPRNKKFYEDEDTFGSDTYIYSTSRISPKYIKVLGPVTGIRESSEYKELLVRSSNVGFKEEYEGWTSNR